MAFNDRFYPETLSLDIPVFKNKLNIKNHTDLEKYELKFTTLNLYLLNEKTVPGKWDLKHLRDYHKFIFYDLYEWAGDLRSYFIEKAEEVLSGGSVEYDDPLLIVPHIRNVLDNLTTINLQELNIDELTNSFCESLINVWQAHPFNEGNTRTINKFIIDLYKAKGINIDYSLFLENRKYYRKAMVVYTVDRKDYLKTIVKDALERGRK